MGEDRLIDNPGRSGLLQKHYQLAMIIGTRCGEGYMADPGTIIIIGRRDDGQEESLRKALHPPDVPY